MKELCPNSRVISKEVLGSVFTQENNVVMDVTSSDRNPLSSRDNFRITETEQGKIENGFCEINSLKFYKFSSG